MKRRARSGRRISRKRLVLHFAEFSKPLLVEPEQYAVLERRFGPNIAVWPELLRGQRVTLIADGDRIRLELAEDA